VIVTELPFNPLQEIQSEADQQGLARSCGLHLSTIYQDIEGQWLKRQPLDDKDRAAYMSGGFLWEHAFSRAFAQSLITPSVSRPPELYLDGITGSPDLIDYTPRGSSQWRVWDTKFTWKSSRKLEHMERYFWPWLVQMKGYLKMMQSMAEAREAELYIFFVNGNYAPPIPQTRHLLLEFGQEEIEENWRMVTRHAKLKGWL
jgi:hypothetical protein